MVIGFSDMDEGQLTVEKFAVVVWFSDVEIVIVQVFAYPTRFVILRLSEGSLWVWSPIRLSL